MIARAQARRVRTTDRHVLEVFFQGGSARGEQTVAGEKLDGFQIEGAIAFETLDNAVGLGRQFRVDQFLEFFFPSSPEASRSARVWEIPTSSAESSRKRR